MTYEKVKNLNPEEFKRFCGVDPETFKDMVKVLAAEKVLPKKSGRPSKLSLEDQILMTLEYLREYSTYFHLAINWEINETTALRITRKVENILSKSGLFNLPGKKTVHQANSDLEVVVVDVAEPEIERPQKKQKDYYSGKQGYHTIKSQVLAAQKTGMIVCTAHGKGRIHDFNLWKNSQIGIDKNIECLADNSRGDKATKRLAG